MPPPQKKEKKRKKKVFFGDNSFPQRARVCGMNGDCKLKEVTGLSYSPVSRRFYEAKGAQTTTE